MNRNTIISEITLNQSKLQAVGVAHVYLFGSVLHGNAGESSDVDLLFDQNLPSFGLIEYARLKRLASELLPFPVDFVERSCLDPDVGKRVLPEALQVF